MNRKIMKVTLVAAFLFVGLVGYQMYGYMAEVEEDRLSALSDWVDESDDKSKVAEQFVEACMRGKSVDLDSRPERLVSVYECANEIGGAELETLIRTTDQQRDAPAPLRWL